MNYGAFEVPFKFLFVSLSEEMKNFFKSYFYLTLVRFHLQAFRHLYVLAVEKRLVIPRDVSTNKACYVELEIVYKV